MGNLREEEHYWWISITFSTITCETSISFAGGQVLLVWGVLTKFLLTCQKCRFPNLLVLPWNTFPSFMSFVVTSVQMSSSDSGNHITLSQASSFSLFCVCRETILLPVTRKQIDYVTCTFILDKRWNHRMIFSPCSHCTQPVLTQSEHSVFFTSSHAIRTLHSTSSRHAPTLTVSRDQNATPSRFTTLTRDGNSNPE